MRLCMYTVGYDLTDYQPGQFSDPVIQHFSDDMNKMFSFKMSLLWLQEIRQLNSNKLSNKCIRVKLQYLPPSCSGVQNT